jgi:hypothetical protein
MIGIGFATIAFRIIVIFAAILMVFSIGNLLFLIFINISSKFSFVHFVLFNGLI